MPHAHHGRGQGHRRAQRAVVCEGSMPTRPAPTRLRVWWCSAGRSGWRRWRRGAAAAARVAGTTGQLEPPGEAVSAGRVVGRGRVLGAALGGPQCRPRPPSAAACCSARRAAAQSRPQCSGAAPSRAMPVSKCRCTRAPRPALMIALEVIAARLPPGRPPPAIATPKSASGPFGQLSSRRPQPGPPQRDRLVDAGHAEPGGAVGARRTRRVDGAVPEPVGLDRRRRRCPGLLREQPACWPRPRRGRRPGAGRARPGGAGPRGEPSSWVRRLGSARPPHASASGADRLATRTIPDERDGMPRLGDDPRSMTRGVVGDLPGGGVRHAPRVAREGVLLLVVTLGIWGGRDRGAGPCRAGALGPGDRPRRHHR